MHISMKRLCCIIGGSVIFSLLLLEMLIAMTPISIGVFVAAFLLVLGFNLMETHQTARWKMRVEEAERRASHLRNRIAFASELPFRLDDIQRGLILFRTSSNAHGYTNFVSLTTKVDELLPEAKEELARMMRNIANNLCPPSVEPQATLMLTKADAASWRMRESAHYNGGAVFSAYLHTCIEQPRLSRFERYDRTTRSTTSTWRVDGEDKASFDAAIEALNSPPVFTDAELEFLATVPDVYDPKNDLRKTAALEVRMSCANKGGIEWEDHRCRRTDIGRAALTAGR